MLTSPEDEIQMMWLAQRNPALFAPIYEHYFDRVYHYCLRRSDNPQEAEDLCSQIFTYALDGLKTYRGGMVSAWLFQIAHNVLARHYQHQHRERLNRDNHEEFDISDETDDPSGTFEKIQVGEIITHLVKSLPDDQRNLLSLALDAGLNSQEIGTLLGKNATAVRVQLHRIIRGLREQVQKLTGAAI